MAANGCGIISRFLIGVNGVNRRTFSLPHAPPSMTVSEAVQLALGHHRAGRLADAEALYRQILRVQPEHPKVLHGLGLMAAQSGRTDVAIALLERAIRSDPSDAAFHNHLGTVYPAAGRLDEAIAALRRAVALKPDYADAHNNLGVALFNAGQTDAAIACYDAALALQPEYADAWGNRGNAAAARGDLDNAIACFEMAIRLQPAYAEAFNGMGLVLATQGRYAEAVASYRHAVALAPRYGGALYNLGRAHYALGELAEAIANLRKAVQIRPDFAEAWHWLGDACLEAGDAVEAATCNRTAVALRPDFAAAHNSIGIALQGLGNLEEAAASYQKAIELAPATAEYYANIATLYLEDAQVEAAAENFDRSLALRPNFHIEVTRKLLVPPVMGTREEMLASRAAFEANLAELAARGCMLDDPLRQLGLSNFFLAYHGLNDRDLQQGLARFYTQACPSLAFTAPHTRTARTGRRRRIGFNSRFIYAHAVSFCFREVVEQLSRYADFDIFLISSHVESAVWPNVYRKFQGTHVHLPNDLARAQATLAALELDVLVFLDIGMDALSYLLAFGRLARAQCVMGGHPVTTGIPAMDYFISSDLAEVADAQDHYSETLVRLPFGTFYFERPEVPAVLRDRAYFGLPASGALYLCPMTQQKMHPDFDAALTRILELDPGGHIIIFDSPKFPNWSRLLGQRFAKTIPDALRGRIVFSKWINDYGDFISINALAGVVLDPFHFGIGSTAIATFAVGTPLVTLPSEFLRGRSGLFYSRLLDIPECVAIDAEDYARKAVSIAHDPELRRSIHDRIIANSGRFYENGASIRDLAAFFSTL